MHPSALKTESAFSTLMSAPGHVIDIGAQNVNGSLKDVCPNA